MANPLLMCLQSLHTHAIDARDGYRRALEDSPSPDIAALLTKMGDLHDAHAGELAEALVARGEKADEDGSFMGLVHRTIMDIRSLFGALDSSILPGLIDGEERNLKSYDKALETTLADAAAVAIMARQRETLVAAIAELQAAKDRLTA
jgi:uncharacterized protein (TIGR02284 family)